MLHLTWSGQKTDHGFHHGGSLKAPKSEVTTVWNTIWPQCTQLYMDCVIGESVEIALDSIVDNRGGFNWVI